MLTRDGSSEYENNVVRSLLDAKNSSPSTTYVTTSPATPRTRRTVTKCATRRTNNTVATSTPPTTPTARLCVINTSTTVATITNVSLFGIRFNVDGRTLCQSNAPIATMIITATSAAMGIVPTKSPNTTTSRKRKSPAQNVEMRVRAPDAFTLIHGLTDHGAAAHAAEDPRQHVRHALPPRLAALARVGVGDLVDELRGEQRLHQSDECDPERERRDDRERLPRQRNGRDGQLRQALRQLALVTDGGHGDAERSTTPVTITTDTGGAG